MVPGTLGIVTDVAGLLVIMVTSIPQMRELAVFGAFWVASIIVTVEILHPILICYMPAPGESEHFLPESMVKFTRAILTAKQVVRQLDGRALRSKADGLC